MIDNVAKDITYRARILAYNRAGDGLLSDRVLIGTPQALCFL